MDAWPCGFDSWVAATPPPARRAVLKQRLTICRADPPEEVMQMVDEILAQERKSKSIVRSQDLLPFPGCKAVVWRGDITLLEVDAIVNAANSALLGCFKPNHPCIDNAIHCQAGPRLRVACRALMRQLGRDEPTGRAQVTPGFQLPSKYVLHTVGPIVEMLDEDGNPPERQQQQLARCYVSCLQLARENGCRSVAFCCISTGVFGYPQEAAAEVALRTVSQWLGQPENAAAMDYVVFNVFLARDLDLYTALFPKYFPPQP
eukprot:GGOE01042572.1.p2 GENE.GGOE01042572.1~~GGOE01042572.1.p2  ORF type:complete len:299 (+),score=89.91 GGOE01042572.1:119-898(+)